MSGSNWPSASRIFKIFLFITLQYVFTITVTFRINMCRHWFLLGTLHARKVLFCSEERMLVSRRILGGHPLSWFSFGFLFCSINFSNCDQLGTWSCYRQQTSLKPCWVWAMKTKFTGTFLHLKRIANHSRERDSQESTIETCSLVWKWAKSITWPVCFWCGRGVCCTLVSPMSSVCM
jgi:hypothetical protein